MTDWLKIIDKKLRRNPVFLALGPELRTAMVAAEVIYLQRMQHDESAPIARFNELYLEACRRLVPGVYE